MILKSLLYLMVVTGTWYKNPAYPWDENNPFRRRCTEISYFPLENPATLPREECVVLLPTVLAGSSTAGLSALIQEADRAYFAARMEVEDEQQPQADEVVDLPDEVIELTVYNLNPTGSCHS
jgi:hypothetical protein